MKKIANKIVVMLCVLIMIINSSFVLIISKAADAIEESTNNKNVKFLAYFKDENGNVTSKIDKNMDNTDIKLYLEISVRQEGYIENANITLENSNFIFDNKSSVDGISSIEDEKLVIDYVGAGETKVFEVNVCPKYNSDYDLSLLNCESVIKINAKYISSKSNAVQINASKKVNLSLINPYLQDDKKMVIDGEVITNKVINTFDGIKKILQISINQSIEGNNYPVKSTKIITNVPILNNQNPVNVQVNSVEKGLTTKNKISEADYEYDAENKLLTINTQNVESDGKIQWNKDVSDTYIITYVYDELEDFQSQEIKLEAELSLYDEKNTKLNSEKTVILENKQLDSTFTLEVKNAEDEIYKGNLYVNGKRNITQNVYLNVNCENIADSIEIEEENIENLYTKKLIVNKENIIDLLGNEGKLSILDVKTQKVLYEINNDTKTDDNGLVIFECSNDIKSIKIQLTKPEKVGRIQIQIQKSIEESDKNKIKKLNEISYGISGKYSLNSNESNIEKVNSKVILKETQSSMTLELNKDKLDTIQETELEMKVVFNENNEKYDLYKNPAVTIEMPEEIQSLETIGVGKVYADEYDISKYEIIEKNNKKYINIRFKGEDTQYSEDAVQGPTFIFKYKVTLDKTAKSSDEKITMKYTNENVKEYENDGIVEKDISIVSPTELITTNKIEKLGVSTVGEENEAEVKVDFANEPKDVKVEKTVINNTGNKVKNVAVTGRFATNDDEKENNMEISVSKGIEVSGVDNASIYYTKNENVTTDLNNSDNGWTQEIEDGLQVKNYMVLVDEMDESQTMFLTYSEKIPENLEYNQKALETYKVEYLSEESMTTKAVKGTDLKLLTGDGPNLNIELNAEVGTDKLSDGDKVQQGEVIKYTIKVTNNGLEDATNIELKGQIPEGTVLLSKVDNYVYEVGKYYDEKTDVNEYKQNIEKIAVGETKEYSYEVRVKSNETVVKEIKNQINANYNDVSAKSEELNLKAESGDIYVSEKTRVDLSSKITSNASIGYEIIIENKSNSTKNNLKIEENHSTELLKFVNISSEGDNVTLRNDDNGVYIDGLKPNEKAVLRAIYKVQEVKKDEIAVLSCKVIEQGKVYRSNTYENKLYASAYLDVKLVSNTEGEYLKAGDTVEYDLVIDAHNIVYSSNISIKDVIPEGVLLEKIIDEDTEITDYEYGNDGVLKFNSKVTKDGTKTIKIIAKVNYIESMEENFEIENKIDVGFNMQTITTNSIKNIIQKTKNPEDNSDDNDNNNNKGDDNKEDNNKDDNNKGDDSTNDEKQYEITGIAWIDENKNGIKDDAERALVGIKARLLNVTTNKIVEGSEVTTDDTGRYTIKNISKGTYLVIFDYDKSVYGLSTYKVDGAQESKNSNVISKKLSIDGEEAEYAVTDRIDITDKNIANINIGVVKLEEFDFELSKSIGKIVVQNSEGTKEYNGISSNSVSKIEINAKKLEGTTVIVEYELTVKNIGEAAGYVKSIADSIPADMKFSSELNKDWYSKDGKLYSTSLTNEKILPGQSKTVKLILTKQMTSTNTGLINNNAEIVSLYNEQNLNEKDKDNNKSNAQLIVSIKTGTFIRYTAIVLIMFVACIVIAVYILVIKKNKTKE